MEDDVCVLNLVKIIFYKKALNPDELKAKDPLIPSCLLTKEFLLCMECILRTKQMILAFRWYKFFDSNFFNMLLSHKLYCMYVLHACLIEHRLHKSIFESFISVCTLVKTLGKETFEKTNVDFSDINPIIVMAFYRSELKTTLCRRGGFRRLVEYVLDHRYPKWKCQEKNDVLPDGTISVSNTHLDDNFSKKIMKEVNNELESQELNEVEHVEFHEVSSSLAEEILRAVTFQLPTLPSYSELVNKKEVYEKYAIESEQRNLSTKTAEKFKDVAFQRCSGLKSGSKTSSKSEQKESMSDFENTVQAVIRYNRSKSSTRKTNNTIKEEADRISKHLTNTIRSLIKILDGHDQE